MILTIDTDCRYRGTRLWKGSNPLTSIWAGAGVSSGGGSKTGFSIFGLGLVNITALGLGHLGAARTLKLLGKFCVDGVGRGDAK
ncbi:hypothetical protein D3C80_1901360 [compost metagenome]